MRRFFYALSNEDTQQKKLSELSIGQNLMLTDTITHHWCRVLRADVGDEGIIFDGFGGEYQVQLTAISKKQATATLQSYTSEDRSAGITSKIALVMSRGDRMDYAIQKTTELGVTAIQLLSSHHGEVNLKPVQVDKKLAHWQQIAIAACEQCGLNRPPLILAPISIKDWLAQNHDSNSATLSSLVSKISQDIYYQSLAGQADIRLQMSVPTAGQPAMPEILPPVLAKERPYVELLIGPEGGLSRDECTQAAQAGFHPWQLGSRILRTETAPVVALATLQALRLVIPTI